MKVVPPLTDVRTVVWRRLEVTVTVDTEPGEAWPLGDWVTVANEVRTVGVVTNTDVV